jgi:RNA polymerase sigma factor (sigma-70 family)
MKPHHPLTAPAGADEEDRALALRAGQGDTAALEALVGRHQRWVSNLALRMTGGRADADDLAQEALVRLVTRIGSWSGEGSFRSWAWRIVVRCLLDSKRVQVRLGQVEPLDGVGAPVLETTPEQLALVRETRVSCMMGMLLCLDAEQRLTWVLAEVFEVDSSLAAELLDVTPAAFRKRLERARADLSAFLDERCGLVDPANPCRCSRKTAHLISRGLVDPVHLRFVGPQLEAVRASAPTLLAALDEVSDSVGELYRDHPLVEGRDFIERLKGLLQPGPRR